MGVLLDRTRGLLLLLRSAFRGCRRKFPVFSGALLKSADGGRSVTTKRGRIAIATLLGACLARALRVLSLYSRDRARQSARIAHGPAAALDLDDEIAGQAVELVGLLKIDGVTAVRHDRERGRGYVLLH